MKRLLRWIPVLLWCLLIYWFTDSPSFTAASTREVLGPINYVARTGAHLAVFGSLAALAWWAALPSRYAYLTGWLFATLYGATDEWHQAFVPGRGAQLSDVLLDSAGAAAVLLVIWAASLRIARPGPMRPARPAGGGPDRSGP